MPWTSEGPSCLPPCVASVNLGLFILSGHMPVSKAVVTDLIPQHLRVFLGLELPGHLF